MWLHSSISLPLLACGDYSSDLESSTCWVSVLQQIKADCFLFVWFGFSCASLMQPLLVFPFRLSLTFRKKKINLDVSKWTLISCSSLGLLPAGLSSPAAWFSTPAPLSSWSSASGKLEPWSSASPVARVFPVRVAEANCSFGSSLSLLRRFTGASSLDLVIWPHSAACQRVAAASRINSKAFFVCFSLRQR